jgi:hypothetical protein
MFRSGTIDVSYKRLKWFLLLLFRVKVADARAPNLSSREMDKYCEKLLATLNDPSRTATVFAGIIQSLAAAGLPAIDKDLLKTQHLRDRLLTASGTTPANIG